MDVRRFNVYLDQLISSCSSARSRAAIETLLKIHRNILFNKNDPKYRKLKLNNSAFLEKIWSLPPAVTFMIDCGWIRVGNNIEFHRDEYLVDIINILLEHRFVFPDAAEWKEETKVENLHISEQKEAKLREKAALECKKELEEYKKDKEQREELAKRIKQQIADDRKHFNMKYRKQK